MDSFKQWALCLIVGAAAGTLVIALSPRGSMDKTVRAVIGIFVVAVISAPFADMLKNSGTAEVFAAYDYSDGIENMSGFMLESFCESVKNELKKSASAIGIPLKEIYIEADIDTNNCIIIHKISVEIEPEFADKAKELSSALSEIAGAYVTVIAE